LRAISVISILGQAAHYSTAHGSRAGSKPEELDKALEERGLPTMVFGIDKPVLNIEQQRIEDGSTSWPPEEDRC
jgi:hypothetical protein